MIKAIVYTSATGFTKEYAEMISKETGLPAYEFETAVKTLPEGEEVIYLGWMKAEAVNCFNKVKKQFNMKALVAVGMGSNQGQEKDIRKRHKLAAEFPVFYVQGGFRYEKLSGMNKFLMFCMKNTVGRILAKKKDRTPETDDMLELLMKGGTRVSRENIESFLEWYKK